MVWLPLEYYFTQPNGSYPVERGFEKYYGCLSGGGSYYNSQTGIFGFAAHYGVSERLIIPQP